MGPAKYQDEWVTNLRSAGNGWFAGAVMALLVAGGLTTWLLVRHADRDLRVQHLRQAAGVAQALSLAQVQTLDGNASDLTKPEYQRLTEQIQAACAASPDWRWIYLMGRTTAGAVFFYADSEPSNSKDHALPGQVYGEAPAAFHRLFDDAIPTTDGPYADRWGRWISALIPLTDPHTGAVIAVLGVDLDASAWKWDVAARAAAPVVLLLVLLIGTVFVLAAVCYPQHLVRAGLVAAAAALGRSAGCHAAQRGGAAMASVSTDSEHEDGRRDRRVQRRFAPGLGAGERRPGGGRAAHRG